MTSARCKQTFEEARSQTEALVELYRERKSELDCSEEVSAKKPACVYRCDRHSWMIGITGQSLPILVRLG
jgi:hypothetical protein